MKYATGIYDEHFPFHYMDNSRESFYFNSDTHKVTPPYACGIDEGKATTIKEEVTCKNCLAFIEEQTQSSVDKEPLVVSHVSEYMCMKSKGE